MIQEHKLCLDKDIDEASTFGASLGYTSVWTPAAKGPGGKPAGGTAILAIHQLGLNKPQLPKGLKIHPRLTMGVIEPPTVGKLALFSAYGKTQLGAKGENLEMATAIPMLARIIELPYLAGGDFNMTPLQLDKTDMLKKSLSKMLMPSRSTCITKSWNAGTTIDFFLVAAGIESFFEAPIVDEDADLATHRPVCMAMKIHHKPSYFKKLVLPPALPVVRPVGPAPQADRHWPGAEAMLERAIDLARQAATDPSAIKLARQAQDRAYHHIAAAAEGELVEALQVTLNDDEWHHKLRHCRARRGKAPVLQKTQLSFAAMARPEALEPRPEAKLRQRALHNAALLRGHVQQSIRTKAPRIDGMNIDEFVVHLRAYCKQLPTQPHADHHALSHDLLRTAQAMATARGKDNWPAVRRKALVQANKYYKQAEDLMQQYKAREAQRKAKAWKEWCTKASASGGGKAHRWCKQAARGRPNEVVDPDTAQTSTLASSQFAAVKNKYYNLWEPSDKYSDIQFIAVPEALLNEDAFTALCSTCSLVLAARAFSAKTATSYDGFHNRHWGMLARRGSGIVARFAGLCLSMGTMPSQLTSTLAVLLPKATTGFRTIGLFPSLYRVIIKQQRPNMLAWEAANPNSAFSFQGGQNSLHKVWAQAAEAEEATANKKSKMHVGVVLWDMADYFERICRPRLKQQHLDLAFPRAAGCLSLQQYSGRRLLQHGLAVESAGFPTFGITAGCGLCSYHVQAYAGPAIKAYMLRNPMMGINLHYDDLYSSSVASSKHKVETNVMRAMADLHQVVVSDLQASVAEHKAVVIASDFGLQRTLARGLGNLGGQSIAVSAANLGVDCLGGRRMKTAGKRSTLRTRFAKNATKKLRILRLARGATRAAEGVFQQGYIPSIGYGSQIWGMPDDLLANLRSAYASFAAGPGKGKNHKRILLLRGDPTGSLATAPLATMIDLIWASVSGILGLPSLTLLCRWWNATKKAPTRWDQIRGPVGATRKILRRIGWTAVDDRPYLLQTREGINMNVFELGPKLIKQAIIKDWHDIIAEDVAKKMGMAEGERLDLEHARRHLQAPGSTLTTQEQAIATNFLVGGTWDVPRLLKARYEVAPADQLCQLCGHSVDTLSHRLLECQAPAAQALRQQLLPKHVASWLAGVCGWQWGAPMASQPGRRSERTRPNDRYRQKR